MVVRFIKITRYVLPDLFCFLVWRLWLQKSLLPTELWAVALGHFSRSRHQRDSKERRRGTRVISVFVRTDARRCVEEREGKSRDATSLRALRRWHADARSRLAGDDDLAWLRRLPVLIQLPTLIGGQSTAATPAPAPVLNAPSPPRPDPQKGNTEEKRKGEKKRKSSESEEEEEE